MADLDAVLDDLETEGDSVESLVTGLSADGWAAPTPAVGWTITHQVAHLLWTDEASVQAVADPSAFAETVTEAWKNPTGFVDVGAEGLAALPHAELFARWNSVRHALAAELRTVAPTRKIDWFGPPMSAMSMATARLMETWAHGEDIADTLGIHRPPTARLRNVAHLGVRTRNFAYALHGEQPPADDFRIELTGPDGDLWTWGPEDVAQRITGPALDFCLMVTRRRHLDDLALTVVGPDAQHWTTIAQVFAGPPGTGRDPGYPTTKDVVR